LAQPRTRESLGSQASPRTPLGWRASVAPVPAQAARG